MRQIQSFYVDHGFEAGDTSNPAAAWGRHGYFAAEFWLDLPGDLGRWDAERIFFEDDFWYGCDGILMGVGYVWLCFMIGAV